MHPSYRHTLYASYIGYITQAIINNLAPLLFTLFQKDYSLSLTQIGLLISLNFSVQMFVDLIAVTFADKIGYRATAVIAHGFCMVGLVGYSTFPYLTGHAYGGLLLAAILCAVGGGLIEVIISPIVESLPGEQKSSAMSLLHSFYCWGHVAVVILSTVFFTLAGTERWRLLPVLWAAVPFFNFFFFFKVPMSVLVKKEDRTPLKGLFSNRLFWLFFLLMICSGASEQAMSQWASLFAQSGLKISKTVGDLLGPCAFALLMGTSRLFYGKKGGKIDLKKFILFSSALCVASYLLTVFSPFPVLSLAGCALCGLSVGILWPGVFSLSAKQLPKGGTALFAFLALAGDVGCFAGPSLVGFVSGGVERAAVSWTNLWIAEDAIGIGLKIGLLCAMLFPLIMLAGVGCFSRRGEKHGTPRPAPFSD